MSEPVAPPTSTEPPRERRRISARAVLVVLLLAVAVVFAVENTRTVTVRLIGPEVKAPLYLVIVASMVLGALIGGLVLFRRRHRHN
jgi:uncharacterized integral membrane protein